MKKLIFVDTSALIALGNKKDSFHQQALEIHQYLNSSSVKFVTTSGVLLEFGNAFSRLSLKPVAITLIKAIKTSEKWQYIAIDEEIFNQAFNLYEKRLDKEWGMVDCTSIVIAQKMGIVEVFTTDHHFKQAGFTILLTKDF
ncbi:type II toxin-antitoxin system VapC family toxin [Geminocystis sp. CENA526]|uniref:type II toxin-antitoxin system VapC family toxin n=1 Tax=Geminocystis sp. CENA526 TaxID=1355871 RepID=UPI003D6E2B68